ncbi:unnamed protein product [Tilletia controversa]|nr:unnamed protein product [Tilletia controversa]
MNWTQEQIAGVPLEVILNHPALRQAAGTISQQLPSGQATQTTMAYPPATFPNIPMPPPPSGSSNSNQALSPGSDDQIPTGSSASNVGGDGMTEAQRRCLRWTKEDAKKVHMNFGK